MQHITEVSLRYADKVEFLRPCEEKLVEDVDVSVLQAVHVVGGRGCRCKRDCSDGCEVRDKFESPATQALTLHPMCIFNLARLVSRVWRRRLVEYMVTLEHLVMSSIRVLSTKSTFRSAPLKRSWILQCNRWSKTSWTWVR